MIILWGIFILETPFWGGVFQCCVFSEDSSQVLCCPERAGSVARLRAASCLASCTPHAGQGAVGLTSAVPRSVHPTEEVWQHSDTEARLHDADWTYAMNWVSAQPRASRLTGLGAKQPLTELSLATIFVLSRQPVQRNVTFPHFWYKETDFSAPSSLLTCTSWLLLYKFTAHFRTHPPHIFFLPINQDSVFDFLYSETFYWEFRCTLWTHILVSLTSFYSGFQISLCLDLGLGYKLLIYASC